MAAHFTISDSESETSEEVEEGENNQFSTVEEGQLLQRHSLTLPQLPLTGRKLKKGGAYKTGELKIRAHTHTAAHLHTSGGVFVSIPQPYGEIHRGSNVTLKPKPMTALLLIYDCYVIVE